MTRNTRLFLTALICASATPAFAQPKLGDVRFQDSQTASYRCDGGKRLAVRYLNSDDNSVALMSIGGKPMLFVDVMSGSGARYVAGRYEWWTEGRDGNLRDLMAGPKAPAVLANCHEVK